MSLDALSSEHLAQTKNNSKTDKLTKVKSPVDAKTEKVVSRCLVGDLALGISRSKIFRAIVFSGLAVGALFLTFHLLGVYAPGLLATSTPTWWMITATATGGFVVALLAQLPFFKGKQKLLFELSAIARLPKHDYHEITKIKDKGKIFLGSIPNRLSSDGERLANKEKVGAVLSLNEQDWETKARGLSAPYQENDWGELGINYLPLEAIDHTLLDDEVLNKAADFINGQLVQGKNVYVHCRAGCGRSAMGIAAYLIKYEKMTPEEACTLIKTNRPVSTIWKKLERLQGFASSL